MVGELFVAAATVGFGGGALWIATVPRPVELSWLQLHWPREIEEDQALGLLRQLAADRSLGVLALEARSSAGQVSYLVGLKVEASSSLEQLVRSLVPLIEVTPSEKRTPVVEARRVVLSTSRRALRHDDSQAVARGILAGLATARGGEQIVLQWLLGPRRRPLSVLRGTRADAFASIWQRVLFPTDERMDGEERSALADKRSEYGFGAVLRIGVSAKSPGRRATLLASVLAGLRAAETPGLQVSMRSERAGRVDRPAAFFRWPLTVNVAELLGATAWPLGDEALPGVPRSGARWIRAPEGAGGHGRVIARSNAPGDGRDLGLSARDALQHLHVLGPTGVGKSTVLLHLIVADIAAGRGVVVVDPKGDLVNDVLARIPSSRVSDVVVLDPADDQRPVGLNPLAEARRDPELIADQVLAVFHGLYESSWGPRTQDILHASLLTLASSGETSLCALPVLLTNPGVRRRLVGSLRDPIALQPFWAWFEGISEGERHQAIAPVMNKLRALLMRPRVRAVLGQVEPAFRVSQVFTERKVLLVSLAKGLIGPEASALLGSLIVADLWHATLGRARIPVERRHPVMVFIDEFQDYLHLPTDLSDALAQARGLGVGLTLAHQHLSQLPPAMRSAVLANARSRVCFQLASEDAAVMARGRVEPTSEDFERLGSYEVYARLASEAYASGRTLPPPPAVSQASVVRDASRQCYGRPIADIEADIARLVEGDRPPEGGIGSRPRRRP